MAHDELNAPLGLPPEPAARKRRRPGGRSVAIVAVAGLAAGGAGWLVLTGDGDGGRARAVAKVERPVPRVALAPVRGPADPMPTGSIVQTHAPRSSGPAVENSSGVKVVRRGGGGAPGALIISIPETPRVGLTPAPDRRLVQRSRFGLLPVIGKDGSKAYETYARPLVLSSRLRSSAPRIAVVVGGMGLSRIATGLAIERLPAAVSLAFAPYGNDLQQQVSKAREDGHEVILQVPMEPFDQAGPGPGPHMLKSAQDRKQMKENLHWHLGRFTGYIGIANFLGAKFSADPKALQPLMEEVRSRGLLYLDDGSSARSTAGQLASGTGTPFIQADIILDEQRDRRAIDSALLKLEALAVREGLAIGIASGLPIVVDQIAKFLPGLEKRGIALVPVSTMIMRHKAVARKGP